MVAVPILNRIPADSVGQEQLTKLQSFAEAHNTLVVRDPQTGRLLVHRPGLITFLETHFPPAAAHGLLARFEQGFTDRLTDEQGWPGVDWQELAQHGAPIHPPSDADLNGSGLPDHPQRSEVENWLHNRYAEVEAAASHLTREQLSGLISQVSAPAEAEGTFAAAGSVAGFENCLVRHLGWWGMVVVISVIGALLIIFTSTGPIGLALTIWLIGSFGGGTAAIIINCAANNAW